MRQKVFSFYIDSPEQVKNRSQAGDAVSDLFFMQLIAMLYLQSLFYGFFKRG